MSKINTYRRVVRSGDDDYDLVVEEIDTDEGDDQNIKVTIGGYEDDTYAHFSPAELTEWMETVREELGL